MVRIWILLSGMLIPLLGTACGSAFVFFCRKEPGEKLCKALSGFSAGVMLAASVWSLLLPATELSAGKRIPAYIPPTVGFSLGVFFLLLLDVCVPLLRPCEALPSGKKRSLLTFAVTLHNLPEGMAVGVILAGFASSSSIVTAAGALALSCGIAIQNIPEGAIISLPSAANGIGRGRAFARGVLSGAVEPIGALAALLLSAGISPALPYILSFAAGAMVYVSIEELIPEAQSGSHTGKDALLGTVSILLGFVLMMTLDIALQ